MNHASASLSAQNTFTVGVNQEYGHQDGAFAITGVWAGTISVQRSLDGGATWNDIATFTANTTPSDNTNIIPTRGALYRIGFDAGNYISGTANVIVRL